MSRRDILSQSALGSSLSKRLRAESTERSTLSGVHSGKTIKGNGEWVAAKHLKPGDPVRLADGTIAYVTDVRRTRKIEPVYNFTVEGFHTYHVGELGVWVHNANCDVLALEAALREIGILRPTGTQLHHIGRLESQGLRAFFRREGIDVNEASNGVFLRWHTGHNRKSYDELILNRIERHSGNPEAIRQELKNIGDDLRLIDEAGPYTNWTPYARETRFNTVNEWVRAGGRYDANLWN